MAVGQLQIDTLISVTTHSFDLTTLLKFHKRGFSNYCSVWGTTMLTHGRALKNVSEEGLRWAGTASPTGQG